MSAAPNVPSLMQQANAALQAGNLRTAEDSCAGVLSLDALNSQAHLMLAGIVGQRDQQRMACEHALRAAQKMGPQTPQHIAAVTLRLIAVGEYERAVQIIRKLDPKRLPVASVLVELSQQLSLMEEHGEALRYLDAAMAMGLRAESLGYLRGNLLKFLGRLDEAAEEYERSLAVNPDYAFAHWALAYLGLPGDSGDRAERIRKSLDGSAAFNPDLPYLQYALFKELDACGDTDAAWRALEAGARSRRAQISFHGGEEAALFERLAQATGPDFIGSGAVHTGDKTPIFVLGMPRTGTTLLERILGGHPEVTLCGELNDFRMQLKWCTDHHSLGFLDNACVDRIASVDYPELGARYLEHVAWRAPATRHFSDKNPGNFMLAGLILKALPHARIVHLRRNPMDSCFSNMKELFAANSHPYSYSFEDLAAHYRNYSRLMAHWHDIAPGRILDVNYEDLVSAPDAEARRVMAYCGLSYDAAQIRVESNATPVSTASSAQVRQP
ncbi:MAG: sulfotransferase, partial [Frankiaceae bacterium]|nr:sulfotransferase [Arenimonas sp.]